MGRLRNKGEKKNEPIEPPMNGHDLGLLCMVVSTFVMVEGPLAVVLGGFLPPAAWFAAALFCKPDSPNMTAARGMVRPWAWGALLGALFKMANTGFIPYLFL